MTIISDSMGTISGRPARFTATVHEILWDLIQTHCSHRVGDTVPCVIASATVTDVYLTTTPTLKYNLELS